eukprot:gnl/MRDRNA2_/MRDRNA2_84940_c0_seq2.p1 gnl/MRDRNA2_/MRDRNA2_84940_c0~~gnl/MRDRNA2_/MRDRNA2_84940_c0_seq2.p1  ORF type:complete len:110 (-),score=20.53 gnl/MRDRNA2_/MRDRNA2_84940_c0_seq2:115-444(-)
MCSLDAAAQNIRQSAAGSGLRHLPPRKDAIQACRHIDLNYSNFAANNLQHKVVTSLKFEPRQIREQLLQQQAATKHSLAPARKKGKMHEKALELHTFQRQKALHNPEHT